MQLRASPSQMFLIYGLLFLSLGLLTNATVVITVSSNESLPFSDMEAGFTPRIPQAGIVGLLFYSDPPDACEPLNSGPALDRSPYASFALVERGTCRFEIKVRHAQDAGFSAVIVYNDEDGRDLVIMSGNSYGIDIPAVFVSRAAGKVLRKYAGNPETRCYIFPTLDYPAWSVMAVAFISLFAVSAVLATFFFVRRHRLRRLGSRLLLPREPPGLTSDEVKSLPTLVYRRPDEEAAADTCVICMEEYENEQKLRVLPCRHTFHAACIDQWLLTRRPFCPVCKGDAHPKPEGTSTTLSESTPLLTSRVFPTGAASVPQSIPVPAPAPASASSLDTPLLRTSSLTNAATSGRTPTRVAPSSC